MSRRWMCAIAVFVALTAGSLAFEVRISRLNTWELAFASNPPRSIEIVQNGAPVNYRYIVYHVANNTEQDIDFFPTFQIETENGELRSAEPVSSVSGILKRRFGDNLLDTGKVSGIIKPAETRSGVAIFRNVDLTSDVLTVYVGGLSGDLKTEKTAQGGFIVLYRVFKLVYNREGDEFDLAIDPVDLKSTEWIWRQ